MFYNYIFVAVYKKYTQWGDKFPGIYGLTIVTLLQFATAVGIFFLPKRLEYEKMEFDKGIVGASILGVLAVNWIWFYVINKPETLLKKNEEMSESQKKVQRIFMYSHFIITIGLIVFVSLLPSKS